MTSILDRSFKEGTFSGLGRCRRVVNSFVTVIVTLLVLT